MRILAAFAAAAALAAPVATPPLPPEVNLPIPRAAYVRLTTGCVWPDGTKAKTIIRHVGQALNIVNLDAAPHRFKQTNGAAIPLPAWSLSRYQAIGIWWHVPTTAVLKTCSGTVKLTVKVVYPPSANPRTDCGCGPAFLRRG